MVVITGYTILVILLRMSKGDSFNYKVLFLIIFQEDIQTQGLNKNHYKPLKSATVQCAPAILSPL